MGWAKYYEDNMELITERRIIKQDLIQKTQNVNQKPTLLSIQKQYESRYLICSDCRKIFLFSAKSQEYFNKKKWIEPKRCKYCRDIRSTLNSIISNKDTINKLTKLLCIT